MSIINKMLQELDRRQPPLSGDRVVASQSSAARRVSHRHEWLWRTLALLALLALAWVTWTAFQKWPRHLDTDLAYRTADRAKVASVPPSPPALAEAPSARPAAQPAPGAPPLAQAPSSAPPVAAAEQVLPLPGRAPAAAAKDTPRLALPEGLRLAESIETPLVERRAKAIAERPPRMREKAPPDTQQAKVERLERPGTTSERAENEFRYAAAVLKTGRVAEAESHFTRALELDSGHRGARQALVAMKLERGELENAQRLLQDGLAINPAQPDFTVALARILVEKRDLPGALAALERAAPGASTAEYQLMRGSVLQRLGRHAEAADAYRSALQAQTSLPQAWIGLGISLEALKRRREASEAFRHALAAGPVSPEVQTFAEQRIRALR